MIHSVAGTIKKKKKMVALVTGKKRWECSFASPAFLIKLVVAYYQWEKVFALCKSTEGFSL